MDVQTALDHYLTSITQLTAETQRLYIQRLTVFAEWCEEHQVQLEGIKNTVFDSFIEHLRTEHHSVYGRMNEATMRPLSSFTLFGYGLQIRAFLRWCMQEEAYENILKPSVIARIKMPKRAKKVIETFTPAQLQALFDACEQEMDEHLQLRSKTVLAILIDTGIRAKELCTLTLGNVHLEKHDPYIKVHGKGDKWREVGLGVLSRDMLEQYISLYREGALPHHFVFDGRYAHEEPMTVWGLDRLVGQIGVWAKISGVRCSPHTFRHTYAVSYLLAGGDCFKLSLLLGHEKMEITLIYLKTVNARMARKGGPSVLDQLKVK